MLPPAVKLVWDVGIAVGPVIGYFYQFFLIRKRKTVGTFSINLCGALLFCNIVRLGFWFFSRYEDALVAQSILMIIAQIFLLHVCVKSMNSQGIFEREELERDPEENGFFGRFWRWRSFNIYLIVTFTFALVVILVSVELSAKGYNTIGDIIGYIALISESLIMLPQIIENFRQRRVKGLSHLLVFLNITGDLMKLAYFFLTSSPNPFKVSGFIQVFLDLVVVTQICYYARINKDTVDSETNSEKGDQEEEAKKSEVGTGEKMEGEEINNKLPADYKQLEEDICS